ncbi:MAG: YbaB/EbfC family nucleoid-associated protein [Deltaproteobacteria bacterium]|nr:YbaB/EbfC family nucleoid-associated protein [Deltaproteobacteria bacterium]
MADFRMPDLGGLMEAAQRMQRELARVQDELGSKTTEASAGGGMVTVVANGRMEILSIKIERSVVDPRDVDMLQDLVIAAVNQALAKAKELAQRELANVTGGVSLPGIPMF